MRKLLLREATKSRASSVGYRVGQVGDVISVV